MISLLLSSLFLLPTVSLCWVIRPYSRLQVRRQFRSVPRSPLQYKFQGGSFAGVFSGFLSRQIPCHTSHSCMVSLLCELSGVSSGSQPQKTSSHMWSSWKASPLYGRAGGSPPSWAGWKSCHSSCKQTVFPWCRFDVVLCRCYCRAGTGGNRGRNEASR